MNIFTITKFRYPKQIEDSFQEITNNNYTFYYEHNKIYESFFNENTIDEFKYNEFNEIKNTFIKKLCFCLYVLYFKGGFFIDLNVIPDKNINNIFLENNVFYCVKSIVNENSLFLGIFGSSKNNSLLLQLIKSLHQNDKNNIEINSKIFFELLKDNSNENIIFLNEKFTHVNYASTINSSGDILFNHYYKPTISYDLPIKKVNKSDNIKEIKIGITLLLLNNVNSFFSNGINQNSLFLCELLLNIGYDVYFIIEDTKLFNTDEKLLSEIFYDPRFKYKKYSEILYSEFNIVITLSFSYGELFIYNYFKLLNTKHVGYFCGNTYIIETEKILYNQHKNRQNDAYDFTINNLSKYDEIWSIPQMAEQNLDFWSILHRCNCIEVPFVWSNNAINLFCKANNCKEEELYYKNRGPEKKIAIFEPNISIMKWALPSVLICENTYRNNKLIKHLYITNINSSSTVDFNLKQFNNFVASLDIVKDKKCSIENRYNTLSFMSKYADIAISHQWGNPLNYLYFDLAWMGWPIIHNAYLCKEIGYFYNNFNLKDGSNILEKVLADHDKNINEYLNKNRAAIDRFLPTNLELQSKYKLLIKNLLK